YNWTEIAEQHVRRARWREAFKTIEYVHDERARNRLQHNALECVAATDKPELIDEAASMQNPLPPLFVPLGLLYADLAAGRDDAALQRARQQTDANGRVWLLTNMRNWYYNNHRPADEMRVQRL